MKTLMTALLMCMPAICIMAQEQGRYQQQEGYPYQCKEHEREAMDSTNWEATESLVPTDSLLQEARAQVTEDFQETLFASFNELKNKKLAPGDGTFIKTVLSNQGDLSEKYVKIESATLKNESYFRAKIVKQTEIRKTSEKSLEEAYQAAIEEIPMDGSREEQERERIALDNELETGLLAVERDYNNRLGYVYMAYRLKKCRLLPAKSIGFAKMYFNELTTSDLTFLNNSTLIFNENLTAFTSNVVSGYPGIPVRFSLNTVVAKTRTTEIGSEALIGKTPEEIQSIVNANVTTNMRNNTLSHVLNGGGFLTLKAEYPLLNVNGSKKRKPKIAVASSAALSGEFAEVGTDLLVTESSAFRYLAMDVKAILPFEDIGADNLGITNFAGFVSFNSRFIDGSGGFYKNLNQANTHAFSQLDTSIGIMLKGLKIAFTYTYFTKPSLNEVYPATFSIGYMPNLL